MPTITDLIAEAEAERTAAEHAAADAKASLKRFTESLEAKGITESDWTPEHTARADALLKAHREAKAKLPEIDGKLTAFREVETEEIENARLQDETHSSGAPPFRSGSSGGLTGREAVRAWAGRAAAAFAEMRAITSGSIDIPELIPSEIQAPPHPERLIDLLVNRTALGGNLFEFLRQTARTINAAPVADAATKPTSVFTITPIEDRLRVVAHLSEPVPVRIFEDHEQVERWLASEMGEGVLTAVEAQVVAGGGTGENMTGLLGTTGTGPVSFATHIPTSLRKGYSALQTLGESPTAWVLSVADAESMDLLREGTDGGFLAVTAGFSNVTKDLPVVVSTSLSAGTAILGDWNEIRLYHRHDVRIDIDAGGPELFDKNLVKLRAEGRFNVGVTRPQAFAVIETASAG